MITINHLKQFNFKNMKNLKIYSTLLLLIGVLFFNSCTEDKEVYPETRLFRPVLNTPLLAHDNTITVDMAKLTKAVSYKVEISRDEFKTVLGVVETTANKIVFTDLLWNKKYQFRATAIGSTPEFNSKISDLGSATTDKFPSILLAPTPEDVVDYSARMKWTTGVLAGAPITQVKVFAIEDEALKNPLQTISVTSAEQLAGTKIVNGLSAGTQYQLAIYSESSVRGWEVYTTLPALVVGPNDTDLRGLGTPSTTTLFTALTNAAPGGTIILDPLQTYPIGSTDYLFDKSLTIKSGYTLANTTGAIISNVATSNSLELANNATIDKIIFDGVSFVGDAALARYVFRVSKAASGTIGELRFVNCKMTNYRDIIRTGTQLLSGAINLFTMDGCIVTNVGSNAVVIVDGGTLNPFPSLVFKNSTFSKVQKLVNNKCTTDSAGLTISDCTFAETPASASALLSYSSTSNISSPIIVKNTIFGGAVSNVAFSFITSGHLKSSTITSSNTYKTSDVTLTPPVAPSTTPFPTFSTYSGTTTVLWIDPLNGNFNFKDLTFQGTKTCGDPRWRK